jgi:hypothetical protein
VREWRVRIAFVMAVHTWRFVPVVTVGNYPQAIYCHLSLIDGRVAAFLRLTHVAFGSCLISK